MPKLSKGIYKNILFVLIFLILSTTAFQNCSSEVDNTLVSNIPPPKTLSSANANEVPFAFDTSINEIAYMSCAHIDADYNATHMSKPGTYFSFKIGAYGSNSGVGLTTDFRNYLINNFGDSNVTVASSIITAAFTTSTQNAWPSLLFSNRAMNDPVNSVYRVESSTNPPTLSNEYDMMLSSNAAYASLTYGDNLKQVSDLMNKSSISRINYFTQQGTSHNLYASLNYHYSDDYSISAAETLRNRFSDGQNSNFLTLTYSRDLRDVKNQSEPFHSRQTFKDSNNTSSVWGRGYKPTFRQDPRVNGLGQNNVLSAINEYDLSDGLKPIVATWNCNVRYLIISPIDNDAQGNSYPNPYGDPIPTFSRCNDPSDAELANRPDLQAERQLIQRYLSATDWIINPIHKCLVPRAGNGDCYQKRSPDLNNDGSFYATKYMKTTSETCGVGTPYACPEFLSLCTRN